MFWLWGWLRPRRIVAAAAVCTHSAVVVMHCYLGDTDSLIARVPVARGTVRSTCTVICMLLAVHKVVSGG
jgi:hypothetical protein